MARKPNYNFEKNRREQQRAAKKEAKLAEKLRRREEAARVAEVPPEGTEPPEPQG